MERRIHAVPPEPDRHGPANPPPLTQLLHSAASGDGAVLEEVFARVYGELHRLAHRLRDGKAGQTLCTTSLVHEAYLKLLPSAGAGWESRAHFFGSAARAMRQILVDAARHRSRQKRGGGIEWVTVSDDIAAAPVHSAELLAMDAALRRLEELEPRQVRVVELRFFAGLTVEETAATLGVSTPTVHRDWRLARAWLKHEMREGRDDGR